MTRVELTLLDDAVVLCTLYGTDGRLLGHGRGVGEEEARLEAVLDMARREALLDEKIARDLAPFKSRHAPKARFAQDAARILGKVGR